MSKFNTLTHSLSIILMLLLLIQPSLADSKSPNTKQSEQQLQDLLKRFLQGASENNASMHNAFWAEELIYTSSSGERFGKAKIMQGLENSSTDEKSELPHYSAQDVDIRVYDNMAIVAFRLLAKPSAKAERVTQQFFNTGTFVKKKNTWQAIAWQATKIPKKSTP